VTARIRISYKPNLKNRKPTKHPMKSYLKTLTPCLAAVLLGGGGTSRADTVTVDSNMSNGFMVVFALDAQGDPNYASGFQFASDWELAKVKSTVGASSVTLEANYNTYADAVTSEQKSYWRSEGAGGPGTGLEGNKWMAASTSAKVSASWFTDGNCNFQAEVTNFTFTTGYTVRAFIKGINPGTPAVTFTEFSDPLVQGSLVDMNFDTTSWAEIEYGFEVQGINANPAFPPGLATVVAYSDPPLEPVVGIPNPGFEIPDGAKWAFDQANNYTVAYPTEGGNPGGYAEIDATGATNTFFGVLVSNGRLPLPLSALSLVQGQKCTFAMDMKIVSGTNIGGFKIDFVPSGTTGEMYPTRKGDGTQWSTYSFAATVPANATGFKLVPLWGAGSTVAYDNIRLAGPFAASAATVASNIEISWPTVTGRTYQVRKSNNLVNWAPFGASTNGNGSTFTVTDPVVTSPPGKSFFQVIETTP
jgi:hypothetical protein